MAEPGKPATENPRFADVGIDFLAVVVSRAAMFVLIGRLTKPSRASGGTGARRVMRQSTNRPSPHAIVKA